MTIYETSVQPVALRNSPLRGIPGAIAILSTISLGVGVAEPTIRETFPFAVLACLVAAILFGVWAIRLYKEANQPLRLWRDGEALSISIGALTLKRPTASVGLFKRVIGGRSVQFAWIRLSEGERSLVVRKGLGALDRTPEWPAGRFDGPTEEFYGDPQPLWRAFERLQEAQQESIAGD